jgi:hypothetical protein
VGTRKWKGRTLQGFGLGQGGLGSNMCIMEEEGKEDGEARGRGGGRGGLLLEDH